MLVILIKQINAILFLFSFKKIASKIDNFDNRLEFDFFNSIQNSHVQEPSKLVENFAAFAYYHREKPNLKSLSKINKAKIQCFEIHCMSYRSAGTAQKRQQRLLSKFLGSLRVHNLLDLLQ